MSATVGTGADAEGSAPPVAGAEPGTDAVPDPGAGTTATVAPDPVPVAVAAEGAPGAPAPAGAGEPADAPPGVEAAEAPGTAGPAEAGEAGEAAGPGEAGEAAEAAEAAEAPEPAPPIFRVMQVLDVHLDLPGPHPVVTLQETEAPLRQLVFPVGLPEATGLAHALRRVGTPRPLSHELFVTVLSRFQIDLVAVRLVGRTSGTYLAQLDLVSSKGREVVPCRPTDGLTLALRTPVPAPILCDQRLLEVPGDVAPG